LRTQANAHLFYGGTVSGNRAAKSGEAPCPNIQIEINSMEFNRLYG
jgi:hypothetical protein